MSKVTETTKRFSAGELDLNQLADELTEVIVWERELSPKDGAGYPTDRDEVRVPNTLGDLNVAVALGHITSEQRDILSDKLRRRSSRGR